MMKILKNVCLRSYYRLTLYALQKCNRNSYDLLKCTSMELLKLMCYLTFSSCLGELITLDNFLPAKWDRGSSKGRKEQLNENEKKYF